MKKALLIISLVFGGFLTAAQADNHGKKIYENGCQTCHAPNIAPALGTSPANDPDAWAPRLEAAKKAAAESSEHETEMDYLVAQVKQGKGAMPPGGMCNNPDAENNACSDEDYKAAIKFMINKAE